MREPYFDFKREWFEAVQHLPDNFMGRLAAACAAYVFDGRETSFANNYETAIWKLIKPQLKLVSPGKAESRKKISKKHRFMVLERDNFACRYCGAKAPDVVLHVDHIVPVSKGGTSKPDNLVTACEACNNGKRAHVLGEDRKW